MIKSCIYRIESNLNKVKNNINSNIFFIKDSNLIKHLKEDIQTLANEYSNKNILFSNQLNEIKGKLFPGNFKINPYRVGMLSMLLTVLKEEENNKIWNHVHPRIRSVSEQRFNHKSFKDASNAAFVELCTVVRNFRKEFERADIPGELEMMRNTFNKNNNLLRFTDSRDTTERNIQDGFENILYGSIQAIRNPRSHSNVEDLEHETLSYIFLASNLLYKIDEAIDVFRKEEFQRRLRDL